MADEQIPSRNPVNLADYRAPAYQVEHVALDFELAPEATIVKARLQLRRNAPGPLKLDGRKLELLSVSLNGEPLGDNRYTLDEDSLTIQDVPDQAVLETSVRINPAANSELSGLYTSGSGLFTQCEPEGFRKVTFFPDRPDVMARYRVRMRADAAKFPILLSNGNKLSSGVENGIAHAEWEDPHPKPSYLFALVAADLVSLKDEFTTRSGRKVDLGIWVERGDEARCAHAMGALKRSMKWDEDIFGLEYDLDIFNIAAVSDFNAGAMENKGLNIFNTAYVLADANSATDMDFQNVERVIAHEYFHNWTGDRVTCRDWFQLSLKEGLTVFRDQEYMSDQFSAAVKRIADVRLLRATQFRDDAGPLAHPVRPASYLEINNFYTTTIYEKGAEVVRMYRTIIGREAFRRGMEAYIAKNDNAAATVEDFWAAMQSITDIDLKQFMLWYEQAGTPEITFDESWDDAAQTFTLTLRQRTAPTPGQPEKQPLLIPVAIGLLNQTGEEIHAETLLLRETEQSFTFKLPQKPGAVSLFRHFSAPVKLKGQSRARLAFLAAHDSDLFNRWDALQQYASAVLLDSVATHQIGQPFTLDEGLKDAIAATLRDATRDPAFAAEALILPMESLLADDMTVVDPDAIHLVREAARKALGQALSAEFHAVYEQFANAAPDDVSGPAMGARALRNAALSYLTAAEGPAFAAAQFTAAGNMTEKLAALTNLVDEPGPARESALHAFYTEWEHNRLVLDKWFSVQARSNASDTLTRVQALASHAAMDLRNPNRVRALIGAFTANPWKFHDKSGAGYKLLADFVLRLDETNPQIAARFVTALGLWRRFDTKRQGLMKAELERILAREQLSRNTYELASKALA
ncbi:aminopeptidase N [Acidocella aminolytica]|uniref:Aminopeptidase N n=1 Tax=Acidocella aminolytica 101 = DSM 11237 TaxID=1120923 RepID=A0A0D6PEV0_9PROT|nr:aminopeptidase N [Acidocella aminolytica]GAN80275.1 aminopeptidase N [Acidocella aminolytica 101 = DSM 11237]GBQ44735.1 aminopeptidase N [Acidocella aminolytica 101 = DSM 11237]SHE93220.1 aminopeptidase N [Acidocella aminolytica 101 = DSM 11237]